MRTAQAGTSLPTVRQSLWLDGLRGPRFDDFEFGATYDVAIVGGGVAGMLVAAQLARRGLRVAVADAGAIGGGVTGYTTGKVSALQQTQYSKIGGGKRGEQYAAASVAG